MRFFFKNRNYFANYFTNEPIYLVTLFKQKLKFHMSRLKNELKERHFDLKVSGINGKINQAPMNQIMDHTEEYKNNLKKDNQYRLIQADWNKVEVVSDRKESMQTPNKLIQEGVLERIIDLPVFTFKNEISGDKNLVDFFINNAEDFIKGLYKISHSYNGFTFDVVITEKANDPGHIKELGIQMTNELKKFAEEINRLVTQIQSEIDQFINQEVDKKKQEIQNRQDFYRSINES